MGKRTGIPAIRRKKSDLWECQLNLGRNPATGKSKRLSVYGKTQGECKKKVIDTLKAIETQTYVESNRTTVGSWLDIWLEEYKKGEIRPSTFDSYKYLINYHIKPSLGEAFLINLKPEQVQKFYNEKSRAGLSARTVKYIHTVLHEAIEQAIKNNIVVRNVTNATTRPKNTKKDIRILTREEQLKFLKVVSEHKLGIVYKFFLATGLRRGELLALRWSDVDLKKGFIRVRQSLSRVSNKAGKNSKNKTRIVIQKPKTKKGERTIPLMRSIVEDLKAYKAQQDKVKKIVEDLYQPGDFVFCNEIGQHLDPRNITEIFKRLLKKAEIEETNIHALRHTFASRLLEANEHPKIVQDLLGHSSIQVTIDTYSHVLPEVSKAAIDKLEAVFSDNPYGEEEVQENEAEEDKGE